MPEINGRAVSEQIVRGGSAPEGQADPQVAILETLVRESDEARDDKGDGNAGMSFSEMTRLNLGRFLGDHQSNYMVGSAQSLLSQEGHRVDPNLRKNEDGTVQAVLNRTQTSTIATHAAMMERPVQVGLDPVESGDEWKYVLTQRAVRRLQLYILDPDFADDAAPPPLLKGFSEEQLAGEDYIEDAKAEWMQDNIRHPKTGEPLLSDDDFVILNDITRARWGELLLRTIWERSNADAAINEHAINTRIHGWGCVFLQWNKHTNTFWLENVHPLSVHPDPGHQRIEQMDHIVWDYHVCLDRAIATWPKYKQKLEDAAMQGKLSGHNAGLQQNRVEIDYQRSMVLIRTGWIKNARVAMTEDEAIETGRVTIEEQPDGPPKYRNTETDEEAFPPTEDRKIGRNWPETFGILRVQTLPQIGEEIDRQRERLSCEPLGWTINIPVAFKPWGLGDPYRLDPIQKIINNELSTLINHSRQFAYPAMFWPASLYKALRARGFKMHLRAGMVAPIPDADWQRAMQAGGKFGVMQDPPRMPSDKMAFLHQMLAEHDRLSGHVEALQGRTQGSQASGRMVQQLRHEARGPLGIQARFLEATVQRIAKLVMEEIEQSLPRPVAYEILNQLPQFVVDDLLESLKPGRYNVRVKASMGRGMMVQAEQEKAQRLYQLGLLDSSTTLERHDEDPSSIARRKQDDMERAVAVQALAERQAASRAPRVPSGAGGGGVEGAAGGSVAGDALSAPGGTPLGGAAPAGAPLPVPDSGQVDDAAAGQAIGQGF